MTDAAAHPRRMHNIFAILLAVVVIAGTATLGHAQEKAKSPWISLFNGKNLDGWAPKFPGHALNENFRNTFRVEDGVLKVSYDEYPKFGGEFGHLFYKEKLSSYRLRIEYRFVGKQAAGAPGWALRNSGVMIHCQAPETMGKSQDFPVSLEVQFLGGDGQTTRPTANLCTPGTNVVMNGKLHTAHCTESKSDTFHGDQWVTAEVEVHGDRTIRHIVKGQVVMEYEQPQYDENDANAKPLIKNGEKLISEGYISLQAESHPIEFRKIELLKLDD
jgi:hypothetical protein